MDVFLSIYSNEAQTMRVCWRCEEVESRLLSKADIVRACARILRRLKVIQTHPKLPQYGITKSFELLHHLLLHRLLLLVQLLLRTLECGGCVAIGRIKGDEGFVVFDGFGELIESFVGPLHVGRAV